MVHTTRLVFEVLVVFVDHGHFNPGVTAQATMNKKATTAKAETAMGRIDARRMLVVTS